MSGNSNAGLALSQKGLGQLFHALWMHQSEKQTPMQALSMEQKPRKHFDVDGLQTDKTAYSCYQGLPLFHKTWPHALGSPPLLVASRANHVKPRSGTTSFWSITVAQDHALDSEIDMLLKDVIRSPREVWESSNRARPQYQYVAYHRSLVALASFS